MPKKDCLNIKTKIRLNNGVMMPILGLGTLNALSGKIETVEAIKFAISNAHISLIDTATYHGNEVDIGQAIRMSGISRDDIFIVTKLPFKCDGKKCAIEAIESSLKFMGLDYIDQYLISWPIGGKVLLECYDVLLDYQKKGIIKSIGVSNFGVEHLNDLKNYGRPLPQVNQIELHPWSTHEAIVRWCKENNVAVAGCCPLTRGSKFNHPLVIEFAEKYDKSPAQILIRWSLQKGHITIPKSTKHSRILENSNVFDFEIFPEDMVKFEALSIYKRRYSYSDIPTNFIS